MKEWEQDVLKQYEIDVKGMKKVRGGIVCETEKGHYFLEETKLSKRRLETVSELEAYLKSQGFENVDGMVRNVEGELVTETEDGMRVILKRWFEGRECDIKKECDLLNSVKNLAHLHKAMDGFDVEIVTEMDLDKEFRRHNQELRKVRSFIRKKTDKGDFENAFLKHFDSMYRWAEDATARLQRSKCSELQSGYIHGDYNYHNILFLHRGIATTNFQHFRKTVPVWDLYYFLRKTMEKHQWNTKLGVDLLDYYQKFSPLSEQELEYMGICFAYPEKFWKTANAYFQSNKTWISSKNIEKLNLAIEQSEAKRKFLAKVMNFHL